MLPCYWVQVWLFVSWAVAVAGNPLVGMWLLEVAEGQRSRAAWPGGPRQGGAVGGASEMLKHTDVGGWLSCGSAQAVSG